MTVNRRRRYEVGYNRASTPYKQLALDRALGHLLGSSVKVAMQRGAPCVVCDMTSGPGLDPNGGAGSPLIIARHITTLSARFGYPIRLKCVDWNGAALESLRVALEERYPDLLVDYYSDQSTALTYVPPDAVGLSYWDTTYYNDLNAALLKGFGRSHRTMDILLTRACLDGYRMQRAAHCAGTLTIQDYLALTGKRRNYIMQYAKHHWWSLGFADNWETRPVAKMGDLVDVQSPAGMRLYRKWTALAQEQEMPEEEVTRARQEGLPWE